MTTSPSSDGAADRLTRVRLTADGEKCLNRLAPVHLNEFRNLAPVVDSSWHSGKPRPRLSIPGGLPACSPVAGTVPLQLKRGVTGLPDVGLGRDRRMTEPGGDLFQGLEPVASLVGDRGGA